LRDRDYEKGERKGGDGVVLCWQREGGMHIPVMEKQRRGTCKISELYCF